MQKNRSRRAGLMMRLLAVTLAFQLVGFPPVTVFAQDQALCALFGTCTPATGTTLLGLPQGTLGVRTVEPWDRVVKGSAATAWEPLEAEARAFLAVLHGVPNDDRLPHAAIDQIRALLLSRLLQLAEKEAAGQTPLTPVEKAAMDALRGAVIARRVDATQQALNEYYRWAHNACGYHVPPNFSFDEYDPGPGCGLNGIVLTPPRPPTKGQFTAYGAALANQVFVPADAAAATARLHENLAALGSIGGAALAAGITAIVALAVPGVAAGFAALAGSTVAAGATVILGGASIGATAAFDGAVLAGGAAAIGGIGASVGASVVGFAVLAEAVTILGAIEFAEDAQILPELQTDIIVAQRQPSITAMLQDSTQSAALMMAFMAQTLPDYATERLAAGPLPPSAPVPGSPVFAVNGVQTPVLATLDPDNLFRETFMSNGWFVTRTRKSVTESFGAWHWALKIPYENGQLAKATLGIQPGGFLDIDDSDSLTPRPASKVLSLQMRILGADLPIGTVTFAGNHSPLLNATASAHPVLNTPVTFTAGASDPDGDPLTIGWYFQDFSFLPTNPDFAACDLRPTPTDAAAPRCPWVAVTDPSGAGVTRTFTQAGSFGVLAVAKDSHGALSSERFFVNINGAPSLALTPPASTTIDEGDSVTIAGTLDYPRLPNGLYATISSLVIDWGDGTTTTRDYPCFFPTSQLVNGVLVPVLPPSGEALCFNQPGGGGFISSSGIPVFSASLTTGISGGPAGPWTFQFSHSYAFDPAKATPGSAAIKVYATTTDNLSTPITTFDITVHNVLPALSLDAVCPIAPGVICSPSLVSGPDIREVPVGSPMTLGAVIADAPGASHAVKVFWGDGSSSFLPAGCGDPGCPAPAAVQLLPDRLSKVLSLTHTYNSPGIYPIQMMANDGGPGGFVTANGTATVFGVKVDGPTDVNAGVPATYALTPTVPASFTVDSIAPSCDGGNVIASTPTSFTCVFADVPTRTTRAANVTSSIAGRTIGTGLSVGVSPRLPVIDGPTSAIGGKSATYTYQPSAFATLIQFPGCTGQVTAFTPGSITCAFADGQAPYVGQVAVTQLDTLSVVGFGFTTTVTTFDVNVVPDLDPPVLNAPTGPVAPSTSNAGANVSYTVTAVDAVSGPAIVSCSPASGALFPIGSTPVTCTADDWKGNHGSGGFTVKVTDATPPTLSLPAPIAVDATSKLGSIVTFSAAASDALPASPAVTCLPASGSQFAIGTTTVTCRASDSAGNQASGQFTVKVAGAAAEIQALQAYIAGLPIDVTTRNTLLTALKLAGASVAANRRSACAELAVVATLANAAAKIKVTKLTAAQAAQIGSAIARIRTVNGC